MPSERVHAGKGAARGAARHVDRSGPNSAQRASPDADPVQRWLTLQRIAGNAAVSSLLAITGGANGPAIASSVQREPSGAAVAAPATPSPNATMGAQLGAIWESSVVTPLARAADRIGREDKDLPAARGDLASALQAIRTLRDATPEDDPNRHRLTSIERIVKGVLDVVDQRLGGSTSDSQFERDLMQLRFEAVGLGPLITKKPTVSALVQAVIGLGAEVDFEVPAGADLKPPAVLWKVFVIDYLWEAQRDFGKRSAESDWKAVLGAGLAIQQFQQAAPAGDPVGPRLFALEAGATALISRLQERIPADTPGFSDGLADDAVRAFNLVTEMKRFLTGQPAAPAGPAGAGEEAGEPGFTWESKDPLAPAKPFENDTNLMRPDE